MLRIIGYYPGEYGPTFYRVFNEATSRTEKIVADSLFHIAMEYGHRGFYYPDPTAVKIPVLTEGKFADLPQIDKATDRAMSTRIFILSEERRGNVITAYLAVDQEGTLSRYTPARLRANHRILFNAGVLTGDRLVPLGDDPFPISRHDKNSANRFDMNAKQIWRRFVATGYPAYVVKRRGLKKPSLLREVVSVDRKGNLTKHSVDGSEPISVLTLNINYEVLPLEGLRLDEIQNYLWLPLPSPVKYISQYEWLSLCRSRDSGLEVDILVIKHGKAHTSRLHYRDNVWQFQVPNESGGVAWFPLTQTYFNESHHLIRFKTRLKPPHLNPLYTGGK